MGAPLPPVPQPGQSEPIVFFDITLGATNEPLGRIKLHLFSHTLPRTAENFRQFCTGELKSPQTGKPLGYKGCKFHRVVKGFILQSGDFENTTTPSALGTSTMSIYNFRPFADEGGFMYRHSRAGLLSMANSGPDTNGCQFFITCAPAPHLDGKHVVFGQVVDYDGGGGGGGGGDGGESMATVRKIENVRCAGMQGRGQGERPVQDVRIAMCGEL